MRVFLAIPAGEMVVHAEIAAWLLNLPTDLHQFRVRILPGVSPVELARNKLCAEMLATDAERLWFIDSDMVPPANATDLLDVEADICAGVALGLHEPPPGAPVGTIVAPAVYEGNGQKFRPVWLKPGVNEVDAVGCATMVIKRRVLEDSKIRGKDAWFRTLQDATGATQAGEDLDFCRRAKHRGYSVKATTEVVFGHRKSVDLNLLLDLITARSSV